ncbi:hypothetical protein ACIRL0_36285 [Streptomyces sp. NPDC102365]|uniref:hypothetical protein n=1 Tax=Streptomyces sp. NPDC102365 TaxID=3366162 RepID=UPI00380CB4F0
MIALGAPYPLVLIGRRHARGRFEREDLQANLAGAEWTDADAFTSYGLDDTAINALRSWAVPWADDLAARLHEDSDPTDLNGMTARQSLCLRREGRVLMQRVPTTVCGGDSL